ncbi:MAG: LysR family transcriptional regulator [Bacteroidia bacterium]|nr:LysR family transcriptional regulator [Bacteroidia bacterium]
MFEDSRIKVFMAVAEERSFTLAARSLGISQPAVSQNISEIEKAVGTPLFERARGSVSLTAAGRKFKEFAEQINYWYKAASDEFKNQSSDPVWLSGRPKKEFRIGVPEGYRCYLEPNGSEDLDIDIEDNNGRTSVKVIQKMAGSEDPATGLF